MIYIFKFSTGNLTVDGVPVEEAREKEIRIFEDKLKMQRVDPAEIGPELRELEVRNIKSKGDGEKKILKDLLQKASNLKKHRSIEAFYEISATVADINTCGESVEISKTDVDRMREAFETLDQKLPEMFKYIDILKQLREPLEKKQDGGEDAKDKE